LALIQAEGLEKKFGSSMAVDGLSFDVNQGEVFGLLGPNGAGKTTTIRLLACLISPTGGWAKVSGFNVAEEPTKVRERVGILAENPCLYERLTAYENLKLMAHLYDLPRREHKEKIRAILRFFDLEKNANHLVSTFSGGMIRKLEIGQAVLHRPKVLFLDEPTVGLDPIAKQNVWKHLRELNAKFQGELNPTRPEELRRQRVKDAWAEQKVIRSIMVFLHSNGVSTSQAVRIYKTYGEAAIEKVASSIKQFGFRQPIVSL
jgi:ABC-2 type transport system ATP-binding protein